MHWPVRYFISEPSWDDEASDLMRRARAMSRAAPESLQLLLRSLANHDFKRFERLRDSLLALVLQRAILKAGADMGNIQVIEPASARLKIAVQVGFNDNFLSFFQYVDDGEAACGTARRTLMPVIVEDVTASPIFRDTPALDVVLGAGARAVRSVPLINPSGSVVGVLSTYCRRPRPAGGEVEAICALADQAVAWIDIGSRFTVPPRRGENQPSAISPLRRSTG